jgi:probable 2-oxoglutarate dehydrogenase E1 component DHKTD1
LTQKNATEVRTAYKSYLEEQMSKADSYTPHTFMLKDQWAEMVWPTNEHSIRNPETGVLVDVLKEVGKASVKIPNAFVGISFT